MPRTSDSGSGTANSLLSVRAQVNRPSSEPRVASLQSAANRAQLRPVAVWNVPSGMRPAARSEVFSVFPNPAIRTATRSTRRGLGHDHRRTAEPLTRPAISLGLTAAPVVTIPARQARAFRVIDNRTRKSCWPATGKPPAWSLTTRPARPPNAGPSESICKGHAEMTDTPRRWDRLTAESDPAFEAFAAYLDTGSLRDAYR